LSLEGSDLNKIGNCLAAWNKVQTPKSQGGLWIINMEAQSTTLLLKQLHKLFNKVDVAWVDLTWKAYYSAPQAPHARTPQGSFWWRALTTGKHKTSVAQSRWKLASFIDKTLTSVGIWPTEDTRQKIIIFRQPSTEDNYLSSANISQ
jgi:hypothetical protein